MYYYYVWEALDTHLGSRHDTADDLDTAHRLFLLVHPAHEDEDNDDDDGDTDETQGE